MGRILHIRQFGHELRRIGAHLRPDARVRIAPVPLPAKVIMAFKDRDRKTLCRQVTRGTQPADATTDYRHTFLGHDQKSLAY